MKPGGDLDPRRARSIVTRIAVDVFGEAPRRVKRLGEGLTNAVFRFAAGGSDWVVRRHADMDRLQAFEKERWAMGRARRVGVPTPQVAQVGRAPGGIP